MKQITLAVHPMSRQVLLAEYGPEPISIGQRDILFSMLTFTQLRDRVELEKIQTELTATIDLCVHDALARHLSTRWYLVGAHLFRWHKDMMCRYADASFRMNRPVKTAIEEWLALFFIEEDMYALEAAYKCWQRWNEKIRAQNPLFFARLRDKTAAALGKKIEIKKDLTWTVPDVHVECAASRFCEMASACLRHVPKRLNAHARVYFYMSMQGLSRRRAAEKLNVPESSAGYAFRAMRNWAHTDPTMAEMLAQAMAYPEK